MADRRLASGRATSRHVNVNVAEGAKGKSGRSPIIYPFMSLSDLRFIICTNMPCLPSSLPDQVRNRLQL